MAQRRRAKPAERSRATEQERLDAAFDPENPNIGQDRLSLAYQTLSKAAADVRRLRVTLHASNVVMIDCSGAQRTIHVL